MKPIDFYTAEPISTTQDIWAFNDVLNDYIEELDEINLDDSKRITLKFYVSFIYDGGERSLTVFSVWFDNNPIMIVLQDNGNTNDIITNGLRFKEMIEYIESLRPQKAEVEDDIVVYPDDKDLSILDTFNQKNIRDYYIKETVFPKYSVGDIVIAEVKEDHIRDHWASEPILIETRCLVTNVHKHNPYETYSLKQIDRKIVNDKDGKFKIVENINNGDIFAIGNDRTIKSLIGTSISHIFSSK